MRVIGYLPDKPYSFPKETIAAFLKKVNAYYDQDYTSSFLAYLKEKNYKGEVVGDTYYAYGVSSHAMIPEKGLNAAFILLEFL